MTSLFSAVIEPLQRYGFMRYGLAVAAIVGLTSALLSCLLIVRRQALLGDAIAHAVLLGVVLGWIVAGHVGVFVGALAAGVLTGLGITFVERNSRVKLDAAMGILFTFAFALALALISVVKPRGIDLFHVLLGNVLGVNARDLWLTGVSGGLVIAVILLLFRELRLWSFDPRLARALGVPTRALDYVFTALLAATIVASLQAVGLILVIAMLITPGATAYLLTDRLVTMMAVSAAIGLTGAVGGLYASFHLDVASGPAMALAVSAAFAIAFLFAPQRGVVTRWLARRGAASRAAQEDLLKAVLKVEHEERRFLGPAELTDRFGRETPRQLARLLRRGLLVRDGDRLRLTTAGVREGLRMVRTHRLLERYLYDSEGVPFQALHAEAERLEHGLAPGALDMLDSELGRPLRDPHGHPIPRTLGELARPLGRPLDEAPFDEPCRVEMVLDDREDALRRMDELGILPRVALVRLRSGPNGPVVRIGEREVEVPADIARRVLVVVAHERERLP
jgi:ABC-type Mn2+/Zn2+ transport system permease subunit/Mn-dependent DtxR family transcriptional regulator